MSVFWSLECNSLFACSVPILQEWCLCIICDKCFWLPMNKGFSSFLSQALHQAYLPSRFGWAQWLCRGKSTCALCLHKYKLRKQDHPNFLWSRDIPNCLFLFVFANVIVLHPLFLIIGTDEWTKVPEARIWGTAMHFIYNSAQSCSYASRAVLAHSETKA